MVSDLVPEVVVVVMETVHSECLIVESCPSDVGVVVTVGSVGVVVGGVKEVVETAVVEHLDNVVPTSTVGVPSVGKVNVSGGMTGVVNVPIVVVSTTTGGVVVVLVTITSPEGRMTVGTSVEMTGTVVGTVVSVVLVITVFETPGEKVFGGTDVSLVIGMVGVGVCTGVVLLIVVGVPRSVFGCWDFSGCLWSRWFCLRFWCVL